MRISKRKESLFKSVSLKLKWFDSLLIKLLYKFSDCRSVKPKRPNNFMVTYYQNIKNSLK